MIATQQLPLPQVRAMNILVDASRRGITLAKLGEQFGVPVEDIAALMERRFVVGQTYTGVPVSAGSLADQRADQVYAVRTVAGYDWVATNPANRVLRELSDIRFVQLHHLMASVEPDQGLICRLAEEGLVRVRCGDTPCEPVIAEMFKYANQYKIGLTPKGKHAVGH